MYTTDIQQRIDKEYAKVVDLAEEREEDPIPIDEVARCSRSYVVATTPQIRDTQSYIELYSMLFKFFPVTRTEIPEAHNKDYKNEILPCLKGPSAHIYAFINEKFNLMARLIASGLTFGPLNFRFNMSDIFNMGNIFVLFRLTS